MTKDSMEKLLDEIELHLKEGAIDRALSLGCKLAAEGMAEEHRRLEVEAKERRRLRKWTADRAWDKGD